MAVMAASIVHLPNEILEVILENQVLSFQDVCNFCSTCSKFKILCNNSNTLWKAKFLQRWPGLRHVFDRNGVYNWLEQCQSFVQLRFSVQQHVKALSRKFYKKEEISNSELAEFGHLMNTHEFGYHFMVVELMRICNNGDSTSNLTEKFYAEKVIRYIRQLHLTKEWHKFLALPSDEQILEKGAVLVAQWCQPLQEVSIRSVASDLNDIANEVKSVVYNNNANHPLFNARPEKLHEWRNKSISDNQWRPSESRQILSALCDVLFTQMGFHADSEMYYAAENSFINMVLSRRQGIPITLSIVFESVARRLGVRCEPVSFPSHFLLRWREKYHLDSESDEPSPYFYIDVFNKGQFLTKRSCPRFSSEGQCPMKGMSMQPATAVQVIERMANNLEVAGRQRTHMNGRGARLRSALELLSLVNPIDMNCILNLSRFYMLYNMDLTDLMTSLTNLTNEIPLRSREQANNIMQMLLVYETHHNTDSSTTPSEIVPKLRSDVCGSYNIQYAVGMIMRHRQYSYNCVIFGWDSMCAESADWIIQQGAEADYQEGRPFYNVLVQDGSTRYAAEDNLEPSPSPRSISDHLEVGRYFQRFCGTHYEPNAEKAAEYPEDEGVRNRLLAKFYQ